MHAFDAFLLKYGYSVLFLNVLLEQIGLPLPTMPILLAMGALAGLGSFSFPAEVAIAVIAALASDLVWYKLGQKGGHSVLGLICRVSLEPDSCISKTKNLYRKLGPFALLVAKFVPGFSATAAPLAGLTRMPLPRFAAFDTLGAGIWSGSYLLVGLLFRNQLEDVGDLITHTGGRFILVILALVGSYIGWKYYQRWKFIRELRFARVSPEELLEMIQSGEEYAIVDLRHAREVEAEGAKLPGAIQMELSEIEARHDEIPRDKDIILYCS